jgi:two-component system LytT family response regulator
MPMRVLIVDDEPLARERIRTLLAWDGDVVIAGECGDGRSAVEAIRELRPDLVFLDVQMPEMDGFDVLQQIGDDDMPAVIFVTAFDQYAIRAFEVCALDYLLKPFDQERFSRALARGRDELDRRNGHAIRNQIGRALEEWGRRQRYPERLVIRSGGRVCFVRIDELDWVEAAGNYVRLHTGKEEFLYRETLMQLESSLPPDKFARIHRSWIVNVDRVKELYPLFRGDYAVILRDGRQLTLSKTYRARLRI